MSNLIGLSTYARRIGKRQSTLQRYENRTDFPKPALVVEENNRVKRLWPRETLDLYFQQIESERLAKQDLARIRAARKRANGALHRWAITMFGPQDASFIKREQLHFEPGGDYRFCRALPPVGIHRKKVIYATGFGRLDAPLLEHDKVLFGDNRSERYLQLTCQAATKGSVSLVEIEFKMKRVVVA